MLGQFTVNIEVVGTCNLACPSCPVANYGQRRREGSLGGTMPVELFRAVCDRLNSELKPHFEDIFLALYSWGEPLLHPRIGELIGAAHERGFRVGLSSNLNYALRLEDAVLADPDEFVVSLSGFHQDVYTVTHHRGDVERVRANMRLLSELIDRHRAHTAVYVHYHLYKHNTGDDLALMARLCDDLGFSFIPGIAYYMPVEKMLRCIEGVPDPNDQPIIDNLLVPLGDQFAIADRSMQTDSGCDLIDSRLDIDVDGAVKLCCASYERRHNVADSILDVSFADIQQRRCEAALCGPCMQHGIHRIYTLKDFEAWRVRADSTLTDIGRTIRFAESGGVLRESGTESSRLDVFLRDVAAGRFEDAREVRTQLGALLRAKYGLSEPLMTAIGQRLAEGAVRRGRDIPWDPARLLFADAVLLRHDGQPSAARSLLLGITDAFDLLACDRGYRDTVSQMQPIVAEWAALPV